MDRGFPGLLDKGVLGVLSLSTLVLNWTAVLDDRSTFDSTSMRDVLQWAHHNDTEYSPPSRASVFNAGSRSRQDSSEAEAMFDFSSRHVAGHMSQTSGAIIPRPQAAVVAAPLSTPFAQQVFFPQLRFEGVIPAIAWRSSVTILSGSNKEREWTLNVTDNHERFARSQGYAYSFVNMSDWASVSKGKEAQWLKVTALSHMLRYTSSDYVLWVDDDLVFTSRSQFVERMIADMHGKSLLIARDIRLDQINTGMMLFRRGEESVSILRQLWRQSQSKLGYCKEQSCFHEQEALNNIVDKGEVCAQVVNPVNDLYNMNTMWRKSHYDESRKVPSWSKSGANMYLDYDESDPPSQRYQMGMNTAHVSGMTPSCRAPMLKWITEYARRFIFGSEPDEESFKSTSPYTSRCLEHLGRKRVKRVKRKTTGVATGAGAYSPAPAQFWNVQVPRPSPAPSRWSDAFWLEFNDFSPPDVQQENQETPLANATNATEYFDSAEAQSLHVVDSLVEIVSSVLPDLLGPEGNGTDHIAQVNLEVNYTLSGLPSEAGQDVVSMNFSGHLMMSAEGDYEFLPAQSGHLAIFSQVEGVGGSRRLRMHSGKAALSMGDRNLSFDFSQPDRGAGVVFSYSWLDSRNCSRSSFEPSTMDLDLPAHMASMQGNAGIPI